MEAARIFLAARFGWKEVEDVTANNVKIVVTVAQLPFGARPGACVAVALKMTGNLFRSFLSRGVERGGTKKRDVITAAIFSLVVVNVLT